MNLKPIFSCFFSLLFLSVSGQKKDTLKTSRLQFSSLMVGFDVLNAGMATFSDRKLVQGFVSSELKPHLHAVAEGGFEKNIYNKNGYEATAQGPFLKIGSFYMLASDRENRYNGFFAGGKIGATSYKQEYFSVPVRNFGGVGTSVAFPASTQFSLWLEGTVGGRVQLFESPFYIDVNVQPRYLVYTSKQEDLQPMIVPGFGKSSSKFNLGFSWNIAYRF